MQYPAMPKHKTGSSTAPSVDASSISGTMRYGSPLHSKSGSTRTSLQAGNLSSDGENGPSSSRQSTAAVHAGHSKSSMSTKSHPQQLLAGSITPAEITRMKNSRHWRERQSSATPKARAAREVGQVLHTLGSSFHTSQASSGPATSSRQPSQSAQQPVLEHHEQETSRAPNVDVDLDRLRQHRLWKQRNSSASPRARASREVNDLIMDWAQPPGMQPSPGPNSAGSASDREEETGRRQRQPHAARQHSTPAPTSPQQDAVISTISRLRNHRFWRERQSTATPSARAAREVDSVLHDLGHMYSPRATAPSSRPRSAGGHSQQLDAGHARFYSVQQGPHGGAASPSRRSVQWELNSSSIAQSGTVPMVKPPQSIPHSSAKQQGMPSTAPRPSTSPRSMSTQPDPRGRASSQPHFGTVPLPALQHDGSSDDDLPSPNSTQLWQQKQQRHRAQSAPAAKGPAVTSSSSGEGYAPTHANGGHRPVSTTSERHQSYGATDSVQGRSSPCRSTSPLADALRRASGSRPTSPKGQQHAAAAASSEPRQLSWMQAQARKLHQGSTAPSSVAASATTSVAPHFQTITAGAMHSSASHDSSQAFVQAGGARAAVLEKRGHKDPSPTSRHHALFIDVPSSPRGYESAHSPRWYDSAHSPRRYESAHSPRQYEQAHSPRWYEPAHSPRRYIAVHSPRHYASAHHPRGHEQQYNSRRYAPADSSRRYDVPHSPRRYGPPNSGSRYGSPSHHSRYASPPTSRPASPRHFTPVATPPIIPGMPLLSPRASSPDLHTVADSGIGVSSGLNSQDDSPALDYLPIVSITKQLDEVMQRLNMLSSRSPARAPELPPPGAAYYRPPSPPLRPSAELMAVLSQASSPAHSPRPTYPASPPRSPPHITHRPQSPINLSTAHQQPHSHRPLSPSRSDQRPASPQLHSPRHQNGLTSTPSSSQFSRTYDARPTTSGSSMASHPNHRYTSGAAPALTVRQQHGQPYSHSPYRTRPSTAPPSLVQTTSAPYPGYPAQGNTMLQSHLSSRPQRNAAVPPRAPAIRPFEQYAVPALAISTATSPTRQAGAGQAAFMSDSPRALELELQQLVERIKTIHQDIHSLRMAQSRAASQASSPAASPRAIACGSPQPSASPALPQHHRDGVSSAMARAAAPVAAAAEHDRSTTDGPSASEGLAGSAALPGVGAPGHGDADAIDEQTWDHASYSFYPNMAAYHAASLPVFDTLSSIPGVQSSQLMARLEALERQVSQVGELDGLVAKDGARDITRASVVLQDAKDNLRMLVGAIGGQQPAGKHQDSPKKQHSSMDAGSVEPGSDDCVGVRDSASDTVPELPFSKRFSKLASKVLASLDFAMARLNTFTTPTMDATEGLDGLPDAGLSTETLQPPEDAAPSRLHRDHWGSRSWDQSVDAMHAEPSDGQADQRAAETWVLPAASASQQQEQEQQEQEQQEHEHAWHEQQPQWQEHHAQPLRHQSASTQGASDANYMYRSNVHSVRSSMVSSRESASTPGLSAIELATAVSPQQPAESRTGTSHTLPLPGSHMPPGITSTSSSTASMSQSNRSVRSTSLPASSSTVARQPSVSRLSVSELLQSVQATVRSRTAEARPLAVDIPAMLCRPLTLPSQKASCTAAPIPGTAALSQPALQAEEQPRARQHSAPVLPSAPHVAAVDVHNRPRAATMPARPVVDQNPSPLRQAIEVPRMVSPIKLSQVLTPLVRSTHSRRSSSAGAHAGPASQSTHTAATPGPAAPSTATPPPSAAPSRHTSVSTAAAKQPLDSVDPVTPAHRVVPSGLRASIHHPVDVLLPAGRSHCPEGQVAGRPSPAVLQSCDSLHHWVHQAWDPECLEGSQPGHGQQTWQQQCPAAGAAGNDSASIGIGRAGAAGGEEHGGVGGRGQPMQLWEEESECVEMGTPASAGWDPDLQLLLWEQEGSRSRPQQLPSALWDQQPADTPVQRSTSWTTPPSAVVSEAGASKARSASAPASQLTASSQSLLDIPRMDLGTAAASIPSHPPSAAPQASTMAGGGAPQLLPQQPTSSTEHKSGSQVAMGVAELPRHAQPPLSHQGYQPASPPPDASLQPLLSTQITSASHLAATAQAGHHRTPHALGLRNASTQTPSASPHTNSMPAGPAPRLVSLSELGGWTGTVDTQTETTVTGSTNAGAASAVTTTNNQNTATSARRPSTAASASAATDAHLQDGTAATRRPSTASSSSTPPQPVSNGHAPQPAQNSGTGSRVVRSATAPAGGTSASSINTNSIHNTMATSNGRAMTTGMVACAQPLSHSMSVTSHPQRDASWVHGAAWSGAPMAGPGAQAVHASGSLQADDLAMLRCSTASSFRAPDTPHTPITISSPGALKAHQLQDFQVYPNPMYESMSVGASAALRVQDSLAAESHVHGPWLVQPRNDMQQGASTRYNPQGSMHRAQNDSIDSTWSGFQGQASTYSTPVQGQAGADSPATVTSPTPQAALYEDHSTSTPYMITPMSTSLKKLAANSGGIGRWTGAAAGSRPSSYSTPSPQPEASLTPQLSSAASRLPAQPRFTSTSSPGAAEWQQAPDGASSSSSYQAATPALSAAHSGSSSTVTVSATAAPGHGLPRLNSSAIERGQTRLQPASSAVPRVQDLGWTQQHYGQLMRNIARSRSPQQGPPQSSPGMQHLLQPLVPSYGRAAPGAAWARSGSPTPGSSTATYAAELAATASQAGLQRSTGAGSGRLATGVQQGSGHRMAVGSTPRTPAQSLVGGGVVGQQQQGTADLLQSLRKINAETRDTFYHLMAEWRGGQPRGAG